MSDNHMNIAVIAGDGIGKAVRRAIRNAGARLSLSVSGRPRSCISDNHSGQLSSGQLRAL